MDRAFASHRVSIDLGSASQRGTRCASVRNVLLHVPRPAKVAARDGVCSPSELRRRPLIRFIRFILCHRGLAFSLLAASLVLAAYSARTIRPRFEFRDFYDYPGNTRLPLFKQDNREFGDPAGYVVAMIESDDAFRPDVLSYVRSLTAAIEPERIFSRVRSLTNSYFIRGDGDDVVSGPLVAETPAAERDRQSLKNIAVQSPLFRRRLISADGKTTAVLAEMKTPVAFATIDEQRAAIEAVQHAVQRLPPPPGTHVIVTGSPTVEVGVTDTLVIDQLRLMPAVVIVLSLVLLLTFRSFYGIFLCLAAVSTATLWTAGLFALLHRSVDIIGSIIPTTILVYGAVDPIFVLIRVLDKLEAGRTKDEAIVEAYSELALPCFLTSLTTAVGFAVFVTANALTIRYYGITVAVGVLLAWLTSVTVLPLLLAVSPLSPRSGAGARLSRLLDRALLATWGYLRSRLRPTLVAVALLLVGGSLFARKQHLDNAYIDALPQGETRSGVRALERTLSGVVRVVVHLQGRADSMKQPEVLKAMERVERVVTSDSLVTHTSSLADLVAQAHQAFQGGDAAGREVPKSASLIAQYLALVDPADRAEFVTDDYSKSHIDILLTDAGSEKTREFVTRLERMVDSAGFRSLGVDALLTGYGIIAYGELDSVVEQVIYGFVTAFAAIVGLEWVAMRSWRIAVISVVPNLLPVVACFAALRLFDIHLKLESALVLCISVGGLFNTTIHFAARSLQRWRETADTPDEVISHAMRAIGPAALFTAVTLSLGFSVLLLSSFPVLRTLGLLSMVTLLTGFVSDMVVTPVLMRIGFNWERRT